MLMAYISLLVINVQFNATTSFPNFRIGEPMNTLHLSPALKNLYLTMKVINLLTKVVKA